MALTAQTKENKAGVLITGVGNDYRSDDAAGLHVVRNIKKDAPDSIKIIELSGGGIALMEFWENVHAVIITDAVCSGAEPATIHRFDVHAQPIPAHFFHASTHAFGVVEAIELARALKRLPPRMIVYGIEGECFKAGIGLSPAVEKAVQVVVHQVRRDIESFDADRQSIGNQIPACCIKSTAFPYGQRRRPFP